TQAVQNRRTLDQRTADELGALDPEAIRRVREEAWPQPREADEVHEALLWMGFVTEGEARPWASWLDELRAAGRVVLDDGRWFATEVLGPGLSLVEVLRGRLEALGPVPDATTALAGWPGDHEALLVELEQRGLVLRARFDGRPGWCDRRL